MIKKFDEFISEGVMTNTLRRFHTGDERKQDRFGNHDFVDNNGVRHKYGRKAHDLDELCEIISEVIEERGLEGDYNDIDVSSVESFDHLFSHISKIKYKTSETYGNLSEFNGDISGWNTSSCKNVRCMFQSNKAFTGDISHWDMSSVVNFGDMFEDSNWDGDVSNWDVSSGEDFGWMFRKNTKFTGDVSNWKMENATYLSFMFSGVNDSYIPNTKNWVCPRLEPSITRPEFLKSKKIKELNMVHIATRWNDFMSLNKKKYYENNDWYKIAEEKYNKVYTEFNEHKTKIQGKHKRRW